MKTRCPRCDAPVGPAGEAAPPHFPFCSRRCRMADLDRWFSEEFAIPGRPEGVGPGEDGEGEG